tara:strand:- start:236 stop:568 length:333 start_codon:yes stop_codon:yes gene_type:complete
MKQVTTENINDYIDYIMDDYVDWCGKAQIGSKQMSETKFSAEEGRNYIKIVRCNGQRSVHSFIVKNATKKFGVGEILMAASWKAPATNFARGTIFDAETWTGRIRWSGIM